MPINKTPYRDKNRKYGLVGTDISSLIDTFKISYENFEKSRVANENILEYYHNRHYTQDQLNKLRERGQPAEITNLVATYANLLLGYYSSIINAVKVNPRQKGDKVIAELLHDVIDYTLYDNEFTSQAEEMKLEGLLTGLMCVYYDIVETGQYDEFKRPIRRIKIKPIQTRNIAIDPLSNEYDYSDSRFIHHFEWVSEEKIREVLVKSGKSKKDIDFIISSLPVDYNHLREEDSEFYREFHDQFFTGYNERYKLFLLVHSCVETSELNEEGEKKKYSIYWCYDWILDKKEFNYKGMKFPYRVQRIQKTHRKEYYGIFEGVIEKQSSINQAIIRAQLMINSNRAIIEESADIDIGLLEKSFDHMNSIMRVKRIDGLKILDPHRDIAGLYNNINMKTEEFKSTLGITDAFLGIANAGDSGRKVSLLQRSAISSLRYITTKIENIYRNIGRDIAVMIREFYTATEVLGIVDKKLGQRWVDLNKPLMITDGELDENNRPIVKPLMVEKLDPKTEEPMTDGDGNILQEPVINPDTEINFSDIDIQIDSVAYNDSEEERHEAFTEALNGTAGQFLLQTDPINYLKMVQKTYEARNVKGSSDIAEIFGETIKKMESQQQAQQQQPQPQQQVNPQPPPQEEPLTTEEQLQSAFRQVPNVDLFEEGARNA